MKREAPGIFVQPISSSEARGSRNIGQPITLSEARGLRDISQPTNSSETRGLKDLGQPTTSSEARGFRNLSKPTTEAKVQKVFLNLLYKPFDQKSKKDPLKVRYVISQ